MSRAEDPARDLAAQDEILQVLYWMRGERLAEEAGPGDLARWVGREPDEVAALLARLEAKGLVRRSAGGEPLWALTEAGAAEGGRRFADEFAGLTRPGHGECADPDCECRRTGDPASCLHAHGG